MFHLPTHAAQPGAPADAAMRRGTNSNRGEAMKTVVLRFVSGGTPLPSLPGGPSTLGEGVFQRRHGALEEVNAKAHFLWSQLVHDLLLKLLPRRDHRGEKSLPFRCQPHLFFARGLRVFHDLHKAEGWASHA